MLEPQHCDAPRDQQGGGRRPPPAPGESSHASYSAGGKAHDTGKDVTEGRRPHRQLLPDTVGPEPQEPTSLRGIANTARADKPHRCWDRDRCLDANLLRACWEDLHKAAASGVDHVTAKAYAMHLQANMEALAQRLQTKRYRATLVRRGSTSTRICLKALLCTADASTTKEPGAGKPPVRVCTGGRVTGIPTIEVAGRQSNGR
jgi:hypothetical protein